MSAPVPDDVIPAAIWIKDAVDGLVIVCAWCDHDKPLAERAHGDNVSHGICPTHAEALKAEIAADHAARTAVNLPSGLCRVCGEDWPAHPKASHAWDLPPVGEP